MRPEVAVTTTLQGHDPNVGPDGTDYLLTEFADGTSELATRPGLGEVNIQWSAPVVWVVAS